MRSYQDEASSSVNNAKYLALLLIFLGSILGIIYLTNERIVLQKVILALVMPIGFCWMGLLTLTYFLLVNNRRGLGFTAMVFTLLFSLCGNEMVSNAVATNLEEQYFGFRVEDSAVYDYVIVLGGGTKFSRNERSELSSSGDRVMLALQMYENGKAKKLICTGTNIKGLSLADVPSPGEQAMEILTRAGVPSKSIELSEGRNTSEEMAQLAKRFNKGEKIGIITSAWHLPRAMRLAQKKQLKAEPIPSNFISSKPNFKLTSIIPSAGAMAANTQLAKELIAKAVGQ